MSRRLVLAVAILCLCACAAMDLKQTLSRDDLSRMRRLGVVSLLGDKVNGVLIGTTALNNKHFTAPVPDWNIDAYVQAQSLAILADSPRYAVGEVLHPDLDVEQLRADHARRLWEIAERQGFDTIVSVWPSVSENFPFFKAGYGIYDNYLLGLTHRCLYASYTVEVYDVASRRRIAWEWGGDAPCRMGVDGGLVFRDGFDDYTDAQKRLLREGVEARLAESLRYALAKLSLAPITPKTP